MAAFFVVALGDSATAIDAAVVEHFPESSFQVESGKWMVNPGPSKISKDVAEALGIRGKGSYLILPVSGYTGRAQPSLWEWLAAQSER